MNILTKKGVIDMLALIKNGQVATLRDECDNIIALNYVGKATGIKYAKRVMGHLTVGATEEERLEDERALRQFIEDWSNVNVMHVLNVALKLNKDTLDDNDIAYLKRELQSYIDANKEVEVRTVERTVNVPASNQSSRGSYPDLLENLYSLSDDTLWSLKNEANRNGAKDLYNACRKVLRSKGHNC